MEVFIVLEVREGQTRIMAVFDSKKKAERWCKGQPSYSWSEWAQCWRKVEGGDCYMTIEEKEVI